MAEKTTPERIISAAVMARRVNTSRPTLMKHIRRGNIIPDFASDGGAFFRPERIGELRQTIRTNRILNTPSSNVPVFYAL